MNKILFISYWNPTIANPGKGIFIHEQAKLLSQSFQNFYFVEVNIGSENNNLFQVSSELTSFESGYKLKISINSLLWKLIYQIPKLSEVIIWREIKRNNLNNNIQIVHGNVVFPCGIVCSSLARKTKARLIISEHWSKVKSKVNNPIFRHQIKKTYESADTVICVSEWLQNLVHEISPLSKTQIIPNVVSDHYFYPSPSSNLSNDYYFSCAATWELPTRLDLIIAALNELAREDEKRVILNIVGEGSLLNYIEKTPLSNKLIINKHGYLDKSSLGNVLRSSDYFIHASNIETFSIVVAEALACGLPVIASRVGALPQLINIDNGVLCDNTVEDWVEGIKNITSNKYDRFTISESSKIYSPESFIKNISRLYIG